MIDQMPHFAAMAPFKFFHGAIWGKCVKTGGAVRALDIRAWGYLTGGGHGALGIYPQEAALQQDAFGQMVADMLNDKFSGTPEIGGNSDELVAQLRSGIDNADDGEMGGVVLTMHRAADEIEKLRGALQAMRGVFDTPIARRKHGGDYATEARKMAREATTPTIRITEEK
jgi:hypothetical protein